LRWQSFNQKKPYFIATVVSMVLVTGAVGFLFQKLADNKSAEIDRLSPQVETAQHKMDVFKAAYTKMQAAKAQSDQIATMMQQRYYWGDFLSELRKALIRSEDDVRKKMSAQKPNVDVGIWIEQMGNSSASTVADATGVPAVPQMIHGMMPGFPPGAAPGLPMGMGHGEVAPPGMPGGMPPQTPAAGGATGGPSTNTITLVCRAVSLTITVDPSANNKDIAYSVRDQIAASPMVNPDAGATQLMGEISPVDANGTFTFTVNVTPAKPLTF